MRKLYHYFLTIGQANCSKKKENSLTSLGHQVQMFFFPNLSFIVGILSSEVRGAVCRCVEVVSRLL